MLKKIKHLMQRFTACCKEYPNDRREFGRKVARVKFWDVLIPTGKSKRYIETLSAYMIRELTPLTGKYTKGEIPKATPKKKLEKIPVWVCWWQGEENMPPIVKACVNRMRKLVPDNAQVHIVAWDNYAQYVDLPEFVLEKHKQGIIGAAHLSDVLRFALLRTYGGAWVDSTVCFSKKFTDELLTEKFYTQRFESWEDCPTEACRGKWCGFFIGGQADCEIFSFMFEALCYYWAHHNRIIDYVFFDYLLWAGYCGVPAIRQSIDGVAPNNPNIWLLQKHLNDAYKQESYENLLAQNEFFKLSYKGKLTTQTDDGQKTVYAHILSENEM